MAAAAHIQTQDETLLDQFISRATGATMADYGDLLTDLAEYDHGGVFDDIAVNAVIEALAGNKAVIAGKQLIKKAYFTQKSHLQPQNSGSGVEGGHGYYQLKEDAVYMTTAGGEIAICSKLEVLAMTRTPEGNGWGRMLQWQDKDYRVHRWAMPASLATGEGNDAIRTLMERGLNVRSGNSKNVIDYLMSVQTDSRLYSTDRTGWHDGAFVTPERVYGSDEYIFQSDAAVSAALSTKGKLQDWRENVAKKSAGNSRVVFAISTAFAGSLLEGAGVDSGGFHIHGTSTDGKTTAQHIAASVWGDPKKYAQTWRATANGLEGVAAINSDGLLILDEIGQANPKEIGETAYMLANGQSKARMTKSTATRKPLTWRLLFLSSGEYTLSDMMKVEGKRAFAGQELRLANIPSDAGAGMGIFENIQGATSPAQFADRLKHSISDSYGTAGHAWLKYLTENPEWRNGINQALDSFVQDVTTDVDSQGGRVALRFALVAHAGELATQAGITGWQPGEATKSAAVCYRAWLNDFGKGNREHKNILEAVRSFIEGNPARFQEVPNYTERQVVRRVGFKKFNNEKDGIKKDKINYKRVSEIFIATSQLAECAPGYTSDQIKSALSATGLISSTESELKSFSGEKVRCFKVSSDRLTQ